MFCVIFSLQRLPYFYFAVGSLPSLIAGVSFGLLLGLGAYFNSIQEPIPLIQIIFLVLLGALMGFRWIRTGNFMPPGMITVLSAAVLVWTCVIYQDHLPFVSKSGDSDHVSNAESVTMMQ